MSDTDDMWRAIRDLRQDARELRGQLDVLEQTVNGAHGELLDLLRNRVYALETGTAYLAPYDDEADDDDYDDGMPS